MGRGIHCRGPSLFLRQQTDVDEGRVTFVTECVVNTSRNALRTCSRLPRLCSDVTPVSSIAETWRKANIVAEATELCRMVVTQADDPAKREANVNPCVPLRAKTFVKGMLWAAATTACVQSLSLTGAKCLPFHQDQLTHSISSSASLPPSLCFFPIATDPRDVISCATHGQQESLQISSFSTASNSVLVVKIRLGVWWLLVIANWTYTSLFRFTVLLRSSVARDLCGCDCVKNRDCCKDCLDWKCDWHVHTSSREWPVVLHSEKFACSCRCVLSLLGRLLRTLWKCRCNCSPRLLDALLNIS